ncbi:MAG: DUF1624 domain-containing protein [Acidobacteria bacterium]|nr:DUF1624 domain-containing protein [Acidobacteriota bacterium]
MTAASAPAAGRPRVAAIDVVRGLAVVLMALDHTRDYTTALRFQPEDLSQTSLAVFLTRWVTHFCAPTFVLLAGVGIGLASRRQSPADLRRFLVTRGLWLLVLELVVTPIGWQFGFEPLPAFALVLWALGWSMIVMAALVGLPRPALAAIGVAIIVGHNLTDGVRPAAFGALAPLWHFMHVPGILWPGGIFIGYPLLPWLGVMMLGVAAAELWRWDAGRRRRLLVGVGAASLVLFALLRAVNGYGNPAPWRPQATMALTVVSFLNVLKYPPSLQFLLMTLGLTAIALAVAERAQGTVARLLTTYGRVPLFFYVGHIFAVHAVAVLIAFAQSGTWRRIQAVTHPEAIPPWFGLSLPGVYVAWACVVAAMYVPCRAVDHRKSTRAAWWWRYV